MILSTHFIAGAAVASSTDSPILLVTLPFILHFLLDALPHWEYVEEAKELKKKIPQLAVDILAGPIVVFILILTMYGLDVSKIFWLFLGGFMGTLPDGLSLLHMIFPKNKILKRIFAFHMAIHNKRMLSWRIGFISQIALDILAIILIILPKL